MAMKRVLTITLAILLFALPGHLTFAQKAHRAVIIPLDFTDIQISLSAETLDSLALQLANYYDAQFLDSVKFTFDVTPPFKINGTSTTFGANSSYSRDARAYQMALTAYRGLYDKMDFSVYDNDGDGYVNDIIFLTPGTPESFGGGEKQFWPQYIELEDKDIPISLKTRLKAFAQAGELKADGTPVGIGLLAHEFGHVLGLKDMYDTDDDASGGICSGLGKTSLMDDGLNNNGGDTPPCLNAIEREMLGIGICNVLDSAGIFNLEPIHLRGQYFKLPSSVENNYYLLENRSGTGNDAFIGGQGMLIYKVDKSETDAGYSTYFQRTLTALERWKNNQVNCNPDFPCAQIVPAKVDTLDSSAIFWPKDGQKIFSPGKMIITGIQNEAGGNIQFKALQPVCLDKVSVFQSSAIITWSIAPELGAVDSCKFEWSSRETILGRADAIQSENGRYSYTVNGLNPRTTYNYTAYVYCSSGSAYSAGGSFTTRIYRSGIFRFIYSGDVPRNGDGSFKAGTALPLIVYNSVNEDVEWTFNGRSISPGPDGLWVIPGNGTLKAVINNADGSKDVIIKEIRLK